MYQEKLIAPFHDSDIMRIPYVKERISERFRLRLQEKLLLLCQACLAIVNIITYGSVSATSRPC